MKTKLLALILSLWFISCSITIHNTSFQNLEDPTANKNSSPAKYDQPSPIFFDDIKVGFYIDTSECMAGFNNSYTNSIQENLNFTFVIEKLKLFQFKNRTFKNFYSTDVSVNDLGLEFFDKVSTPFTKVILKSLETISRKDNDGVILVTDGIDDEGSLTDRTLYIETIKKWISDKKGFQLISLPMLFHGKRYYSPANCCDINSCPYGNIDDKYKHQMLYILIFSNDDARLFELGSNIFKTLTVELPEHKYEYACFNNYFMKYNIKSCTLFDCESTYQTEGSKKAKNPDLDFVGKGNNDYTYFYKFSNDRNSKYIDSNAFGDKITNLIEVNKLSIGKFEGELVLPNFLTLKFDDLRYQLKVLKHNEKTNMFDIYQYYPEDGSGITDIVKTIDPKNKHLNIFKFKTNNILVPIKDLYPGGTYKIILKFLPPADLHLNKYYQSKTIISDNEMAVDAQFVTLNNIMYFSGLKMVTRYDDLLKLIKFKSEDTITFTINVDL